LRGPAKLFFNASTCSPLRQLLVLAPLQRSTAGSKLQPGLDSRPSASPSGASQVARMRSRRKARSAAGSDSASSLMPLRSGAMALKVWVFQAAAIEAPLATVIAGAIARMPPK
jgi:hypothetical protein